MLRMNQPTTKVVVVPRSYEVDDGRDTSRLDNKAEKAFQGRCKPVYSRLLISFKKKKTCQNTIWPPPSIST